MDNFRKPKQYYNRWNGVVIMKINKNMIITLDNKESYFVASTCIYNDQKYGLLISINKDDDYTIAKISSEYIEKIKNEDDLTDVYPLLNKDFN